MDTPFRLYIGGQWLSGDKTEAVANPYDGSVAGEVHVGAEADIDRAIEAAYSARRALAGLTNAARGAALDKIEEGLIAHRNELSEGICRESGKPIRDSRLEVDRAAHVFQIAAEEARRFGAGETIPLDRIESSAHRVGIARRFPAGVVGAITPFNFPLNLVAHKVAPALAAGNPVVLKPAHQTPLTAFRLVRIVDSAGLPAGSFNVVHAAPILGERLATDPRVAVLSFTGSARVGWHLREIASRKKVVLELGGNAAVIVHDDADLDSAAARCAAGAFAYAGQVCISVQRIFVQDRVYDTFVERLLERARALKVGDPLSETTDLGPMIDENAAKRVQEWIAEAVDAGARLLLGTGRATGHMMHPVILADVPSDTTIWREEAFGPVAIVTPYAEFADALASVNDSRYGLQAGVFTRDMRRIWHAFETLEVGGVIANDTPNYRIDHMPYGGVKDSGSGREGVKYAMEDMSDLRLLALNLS